MNRELLDHYLDELTFLREAGVEFARENPRQAALLAPDATAVADPFVERLLEGTAFLTARVQQTIKRQFPRFTQGLLAMAYPLAVSPVPSMAVVQFAPRPGSTGPTPVSRGTVLRSPPVGAILHPLHVSHRARSDRLAGRAHGGTLLRPRPGAARPARHAAGEIRAAASSADGQRRAVQKSAALLANAVFNRRRGPDEAAGKAGSQLDRDSGSGARHTHP